MVAHNVPLNKEWAGRKGAFWLEQCVAEPV